MHVLINLPDINYAVASKVDKSTSFQQHGAGKICDSILLPKQSEARTYFARVTTELNSHLQDWVPNVQEVNGEDKLRILHDF